MTNKQKIAVFFGGRSPEHDVSVVSGLQVLSAIDQNLYEAFPVYIDPKGRWLIGDVLRKRDHYLLHDEKRAETVEVTLDVSATKPTLVEKKTGFFGSPEIFEFDVALPIFHGNIGEDGQIQGLFEVAHIPYTGPRTMACSVFMDKAATKLFLKSLDIPVLDYAVFVRPETGLMIPQKNIEAIVEEAKISFPACLKPVHLGSSIGVAKVETIEEIAECLPGIFKFDTSAILEPFVENLVEYNVAVSKMFGEVKTSAIERPKATDELLDFKQKYLSGAEGGGDKLTGSKTGERVSEGMLSLTRELNPDLSIELEQKIQDWAQRVFIAVDGAGAPRIDFMCNQKTGELWMNEINPIPGSVGYFLWEAAKEPILFTNFLSAMIQEAIDENKICTLPDDPVPEGARLLKRA